jgi:hypothetical protein
MELVVDDLSLGCVAVLECRGAKGLPHIHDGDADFARFYRAQPGVERVHALLGAVFAAEPDRPTADQVADDNSVAVPLADGDLVDADGPGGGRAGAAELLPHVLLVQVFDRVPVEVQFLGHLLDGGGSAAPAHEEGKALGVQRVVGQPIEALGFHGLAAGAIDPPPPKGKVDTAVAAGEVAHPTQAFVVGAATDMTTDPAGCFFRRRRRRMTTAIRSPKRPRTFASGANPGKR